MLTRLLLLFGLFTVTCVSQSVSFAQVTVDPEHRPSIAEYRVLGLKALERKDTVGASDAADRILEAYEKDPRAMRAAADLYLRSGKIRSSIKQFERYLDAVPNDKPELWQYGIALAMAGRYEDGRKLFELHRVVNPNDVENAAWHFLCVAKQSGIKEAKKLVLPAPGDARVPMEEIRRMLIDGDESRVTTAIEGLSPDSPEHKTADFYGKLYLALYADSEGKTDKAIELLEAATQVEQSNYMSDVARVYLNELTAARGKPNP